MGKGQGPGLAAQRQPRQLVPAALKHPMRQAPRPPRRRLPRRSVAGHPARRRSQSGRRLRRQLRLQEGRAAVLRASACQELWPAAAAAAAAAAAQAVPAARRPLRRVRALSTWPQPLRCGGAQVFGGRVRFLGGTKRRGTRHLCFLCAYCACAHALVVKWTGSATSVFDAERVSPAAGMPLTWA